MGGRSRRMIDLQSVVDVLSSKLVFCSQQRLTAAAVAVVSSGGEDESQSRVRAGVRRNPLNGPVLQAIPVDCQMDRSPAILLSVCLCLESTEQKNRRITIDIASRNRTLPCVFARARLDFHRIVKFQRTYTPEHLFAETQRIYAVFCTGLVIDIIYIIIIRRFYCVLVNQGFIDDDADPNHSSFSSIYF